METASRRMTVGSGTGLNEKSSMCAHIGLDKLVRTVKQELLTGATNVVPWWAQVDGTPPDLDRTSALVPMGLRG
jgi:hypothetical protein